MKRIVQRAGALSLALMLLAGSSQALTLRYNSRGEDVKTLQTALAQLGFYQKSVDGIYGSGTRKAVRAFQTANDLSADGVAGPKTLGRIEELTGIDIGGSTSSGGTEEETPSVGTGLFGGVYTTIKYGDKGARVKTLQQALKALGYAISKVDGNFGSGTYAAVREFQRSEKLAVDGKAGKNTLKKLESYFDEDGNLLGGSGTVTPPAEEEDTPDYTIPTRTLRYGATGDDVKYTQQRLAELKYYSGSADGKFGTSMLTAVKAFQKKNDLSADGVIGPATRKVLFSADALAADAVEEEEFRTLRLGMEGEDVGRLQLRLKALGYYTGTADGVYGTGTMTAVMEFQLRNGLTANGVCNEATANKAYASDAIPAEDEEETFRELKLGMEGDDVKELQQRLKELGYLTGTADGKYGSDTTIAVAEFQQRNSLTVNGVCSEATWNKVFSVTAVPKYDGTEEDEEEEYPVIPSDTLEMGESGAAVKSLQTRLKELGYYTGTVDGNFGSSTYTAVKAFQTRNGLTVDGKAGKYTLARLYSDEAIAADDDETEVETPLIPDRILRYGMEGDDVKSVQTRLKELGYYTGELDGVFSSGTLLAVRAFQQNNNLVVDGAAGPNTNKLLFSEKAEGAPADTSIIPQRDLSLGDSGDDVKSVQQRLRQLGFYTSTVDGTYGSSTTAAMLAFQQMNGLPATGNGDSTTYARLYSDDALNDEGMHWGEWGDKYTTLRLGATGTEVIRLQQALLNLKYDVTVTGTYDATTRAAVIKFQKLNGLTADGIAGKATQTRLYTGDCVTGDNEEYEGEGEVPTVSTGNGGGPSSTSEVKWLMWIDEVKPQLGSADILLVYEPSTNTSYRIRVYARGRHLDAEPYTIQDTALMKAAWGGEFAWDEKPVYVRLPSGVWCIASTHSMPHEENGLVNNGFVGHLCVHFPRTMEETIAAGDTKNGVRHQNDIRKHWLALTGENITW